MSIPMTRKGFDNLQNEVDELKRKVPGVQKAISEAREMGDLRENAEYHAARESLQMLEAQIRDKEHQLSQADIIKAPESGTETVEFGATVKIFSFMFNKEETFTLVGKGEDDALQNRILTTSPKGSAMLGKKVGETFVVDAPAGKLQYKVLEVTYE